MGDVDAWTERAALLALLHERPPLPGEQRRASWSEIALEASLRGSASSLWHETRALTLDGMTDPLTVTEIAAYACGQIDHAPGDLEVVLMWCRLSSLLVAAGECV